MIADWIDDLPAQDDDCLKQAVAGASFLDPYLRWAVATDWRAFVLKGRWAEHGGTPPPPGAKVQLLIRVRDREMYERLRDNPALDLEVDDVVYGSPIPGTPRSFARHFTARIEVERLAHFVALQEPELQWELALPLRAADALTAREAPGRFGEADVEDAFWPPNVLACAIDRRGRLAHEIGGGTIAVIDSGCPFLHENLTGGSRHSPVARMKALWDQGRAPRQRAIGESAEPSWPWQPPTAFSFGRELGGQDIQKMVGALRDGGCAAAYDETTAYRGIDHLIAYRDARRRVWHSTHGAHVLDLAGGTLDPLTGERDAASDANLVFVQLPSLTAADSSGGSLGAHLLDAVRWVLAVTKTSDPLVINISYGSQASSHDGSSLIESALDELLDARRDNFAIVVAAGNSRLDGAHACRFVQPGRSAAFHARLIAGDTTDTFVETWYDPSTLPANVHVEARVRGPEGIWSDWIAPGAQRVLRARTGGQALAMLRHDLRVPNGAKALIVLAVAPTLAPAEQNLCPASPGPWDIEVRMAGKGTAAIEAPLRVDAWIERDDPGLAAGELAHFADLDRGDEDHTLSSLACGTHTVVVGGCWRDSGQPVPYSSTGPRDRPQQLPLVWAVSDDSPQEPGLLAAAVRSTDGYRMTGTSVAAPVVTRRLYNLMRLRRRPLRRDTMGDHLVELCKRYGDIIRLQPAVQTAASSVARSTPPSPPSPSPPPRAAGSRPAPSPRRRPARAPRRRARRRA